MFGIDSANGEIVWSKVFGLGWAVEVGARVFALNMFTLKAVGDGDVPQVAIVAQRKADNVSHPKLLMFRDESLT